MYTHGMKPKPQLIRRNIAIWSDDYMDMKAYAEKERISIAALIRMAVHDYIGEANG